MMLAPIQIDLQHLAGVRSWGRRRDIITAAPTTYNCAVSKQTSQVLALSLVTLTSSQSLFSPSPVSHAQSRAFQRVVPLPSPQVNQHLLAQGVQVMVSLCLSTILLYNLYFSFLLLSYCAFCIQVRRSVLTACTPAERSHRHQAEDMLITLSSWCNSH